MYKLSDEKLKGLGAFITTKEIKQQPRLWGEAYEIYTNNKEEIENFINNIKNKHSQIRVILTGAGTSAYVGNTILPYLKNRVDTTKIIIEAIPTTDLVSNPYDYLKRDIPTLLVSFARSGNSPESLAALNLGREIVKDFYNLSITCSEEGQLAKITKNDEKNYVLLMPKDSNDQGFAMTGSFSCMMLSALLIFSDLGDELEKYYIKSVVHMGNEVIENEEFISKFLEGDFDRVVYLGSGSLGGLTQESQLKLLELTAGKVATLYDTSMGFRHGPKSFINENTLVFGFVSNDIYTRKYDLDILEEIKGDEIAKCVCAISVNGETNFSGETFSFEEKYKDIPDVFLALPYIIFSQTIGLLASIKVNNKPDTPSPTGTVNRVVKGVIIHNYQA